ncbi:hypothetical protein PGQ11_005884 [Apiospora arundinis]|uniref:Uncharacterized protein n=1 Tax=Apiospora arundinis TaxID=335852 RepID=A0ABR2IQY2_9PEZI
MSVQLFVHDTLLNIDLKQYDYWDIVVCSQPWAKPKPKLAEENGSQRQARSTAAVLLGSSRQPPLEQQVHRDGAPPALAKKAPLAALVGHVDEPAVLAVVGVPPDPGVVELVAAYLDVARVARVDLDREQRRVGERVPLLAVGLRAAVQQVIVVEADHDERVVGVEAPCVFPEPRLAARILVGAAGFEVGVTAAVAGGGGVAVTHGVNARRLRGIREAGEVGPGRQVHLAQARHLGTSRGGHGDGIEARQSGGC